MEEILAQLSAVISACKQVAGSLAALAAAEMCRDGLPEQVADRLAEIARRLARLS